MGDLMESLGSSCIAQVFAAFPVMGGHQDFLALLARFCISGEVDR